MVTKRVIVPPRFGDAPASGAIDPLPDTRPHSLEAEAAIASVAPAAVPIDDVMLAAAAMNLPRPVPAPARGPFLPLLLATLSYLLLMGFQTTQLVRDREALKTASTQVEQAVEKATKLRNSLDALAADTHRLADSGNVQAQRLIAELRSRGVTINPAAAGK